jgi:excisionase family DNA binding protein
MGCTQMVMAQTEVFREGITEMAEVLNSEEAARFLRMHVKTALRLARQGRIPGCKVGGEWRFLRSELTEWLRGISNGARLNTAGVRDRSY